jgi:group I intron endonuclease
MLFNSLHLSSELKVAKETLQDSSGIYCLMCKNTGTIYIGSSANLGERLIAHVFNYSSNAHLQLAIAKYGLGAFVFSVLELCSLELLLTREQHWLDWLFSLPSNLRYNFLRVAGSSLGYKHTEETKQAMKDSYSEERRDRIGSLNRGQSLSAETKAKISASSYPRSEEVRAKLRKQYSKPVALYNPDGSLYLAYPGIRVMAKD